MSFLVSVRSFPVSSLMSNKGLQSPKSTLRKMMFNSIIFLKWCQQGAMIHKCHRLIRCIFLHYVPPCVFPEIPETPMSREFTVSFIVNLLSSLFREATCGECIYRRSDPLRGWLGLGFGARRPVGCSAAPAVVGASCVSLRPPFGKMCCVSLCSVCVCLIILWIAASLLFKYCKKYLTESRTRRLKV